MGIYVNGVENESGTTNGPLSSLQSRRIKSAITKAFPYAEIKFNKGHYYCSCFVRFSDGRIVYLMTSDYRGGAQDFLVRTATSMTDYTGGRNRNYNGFESIIKAITDLHSEGL